MVEPNSSRGSPSRSSSSDSRDFPNDVVASGQARKPPRYSTALVAGAIAGVSVDVSLFPLDTLKTRAQSSQGFWAAGGFKNIYSGLSSVAAGSAPGAAIFFLSYESLKPILSSHLSSPALSHMASASIAETLACLVRVPTEVLKSRMQAGVYKEMGLAASLGRVLRVEGIRGLWKGFGTTVAREIPFTCIQFPLYERLKLLLLVQLQQSTPAGSPLPTSLPAYSTALIGSFSGAVAAATTTPLDVVKTRLMLAERASTTPSSSSTSSALTQTQTQSGGINQRFLPTLTHIYQSEGLRGLFRGVVPRTIWISLGGAVFLGSFEAAVKVLE